MPDLSFHVESAQAVPYAAAPMLALKIRIRQTARPQEPLAEIHSIALQCQVRLEPGLRRYSPAEQEKLVELFGEPRRWGQTVRSTLWVNTSVAAPAFTDEVAVELPLPCTFDFNIAQTKYFHALDDGDVPLCLLFSGTIFYLNPDGALQIQQISWEKEASFRLPVQIWKRMMDLYYPNTAWLCIQRDVLDRLARYKIRSNSATWEQALESLLNAAPADASAPPIPAEVRP